MSGPVIYVLAGPNGAGKTTSFRTYIQSGLSFVNADEISRMLKEANPGVPNLQEVANGMANQRMGEFIRRNESFSYETNLADLESWKFLEGMKGTYKIDLIHVSASLETCINRVFNRVAEGAHFVKPELVASRHLTGIKLLKHYFNLPDNLTIINNESYIAPEVVFRRIDSDIAERKNNLPVWLEDLRDNIFPVEQIPPSEKEETIEEVRKRYNKGKGIAF